MVTGIEHVAGRPCHICDGPATHIYGDIYLCCDCHAGKGHGLYTREQAESEHRKHTPTEKQHESDSGE